jgi:serine phosphatase RsbU (regulator of sigma subunit)
VKVKNFKFNSIDELDKLDLSKYETTKTAIQIFSGFATREGVEKIVSTIKNKNSELKFIGASTAGEIYNGSVYESTVTLSIMEFDNTTLEVGYFINKDDYQLGVDVANSLFTPNTKVMVLFIDGLKTNGNDVVDGISSVNHQIPIAGGLAGDNGSFTETFIFSNSGVYNRGVVAMSLNSDLLTVMTDYQLNWQPIGQEMVVTKAEKNHLYEVDGINVSEIYRKYLGDKVGDNLPFSATEFPLLKIEDDGVKICRTFVHQFDDGSLLTIGNLAVGDRVKLAFGNVDLVLSNTKDNINNYQNFHPEAIYTYSCTARRAFLQSEINIELSPLNIIAPTSGFFTYGEIFHKDSKNSLLNITLTILGLSEDGETHNNQSSEISLENREKNFITNKHFLALDALTNLSNRVIQELEESHKNINDSIAYASLIQHSILPSQKPLERYFKDSFLFWEPKSQVGGDIYFITELDSRDELLIMVIDCTGHGVPGAFVTMLVKAIETQIVGDIASKKLEPSPAKILQYFNSSIKELLRQDREDSLSDAGFDGQVIYFKKSQNIIKCASARNDIFYIQNGELHTIKGDRSSIGYKNSNIEFSFKEYSIDTSIPTSLYLSSDGYWDQLGGERERSFGKKRLKSLIKKIADKPMVEQEGVLMSELLRYQRNFERQDDITFIGLKI